jgi:hypothetical protein
MGGQRNRTGESGSVLVEATVGMVMILYIALAVVQLVLVFHATLAAQSAATRSARAVALNPAHDPASANQVYWAQQGVSLRSLKWDAAPVCGQVGGAVKCTALVRVPTVLPAAALFFGGGLTGPILVAQQGYFPFSQ